MSCLPKLMMWPLADPLRLDLKASREVWVGRWEEIWVGLPSTGQVTSCPGTNFSVPPSLLPHRAFCVNQDGVVMEDTIQVWVIILWPRKVFFFFSFCFLKDSSVLFFLNRVTALLRLEQRVPCPWKPPEPVTGQSLQPRVAFLPGPARLLPPDNPGPPLLLPQRFPHSCGLIIQGDCEELKGA